MTTKAPRSRSVVYHQNPFYDSMFGFFHLVVPSKRVRYRIDHGQQLIELKLSQSGLAFEEAVRNDLQPEPGWPFTGPVFVAVSVGLPQRDFIAKDVDNMVKSIIDALKGVVYRDDRQVCAIYANKHIAKDYWFMVGVRRFRANDSGWFAPKLYSTRKYWRRRRGE